MTKPGLHKSGAPYCDGEYCDEAGAILNLQPPHANKRFCMTCLQKYVYNRALNPIEKPDEPQAKVLKFPPGKPS